MPCGVLQSRITPELHARVLCAQVDELLSLQHLEGRDMDGKKVHDEHLFIIVHQGMPPSSSSSLLPFSF